MVRYAEIATAGDRRTFQLMRFDVGLVCFSLVDPRSYENILKEYYAHFTTWRFDMPILVVGTKCDLVND